MEPHLATDDHVYLLVFLFSGWRIEQDKTQQTVTLVETARALFTGGSFSMQLHQIICIILPSY